MNNLRCIEVLSNKGIFNLIVTKEEFIDLNDEILSFITIPKIKLLDIGDSIIIRKPKHSKKFIIREVIYIKDNKVNNSSILGLRNNLVYIENYKIEWK